MFNLKAGVFEQKLIFLHFQTFDLHSLTSLNYVAHIYGTNQTNSKIPHKNIVSYL